MNRRVWLGAGLAALVLVAVALWPGEAPPPEAAAPAPATTEGPARSSDAFLHANWDTTPPKQPARTPDARTPQDRTAVELPPGLSGVEVALPVAPPEKQR